MTAAAIDRTSTEVLGARALSYGAAELKRLQSAYLRRALLLACLLTLTAEGLILLGAGLLSGPRGELRAEFRVPRTIDAPPTLLPNQMIQTPISREGLRPEIGV